MGPGPAVGKPGRSSIILEGLRAQTKHIFSFEILDYFNNGPKGELRPNFENKIGLGVRISTLTLSRLTGHSEGYFSQEFTILTPGEF